MSDKDVMLPEAWVSAKLPDVALIIMGQSPPGRTYNENGDGLPFFQGKAEFGKLHPTVRKWCTEPNKIAEAGDILLSIRAPVGPTNMAESTCAIGRGLAAVRSFGGIPSHYLLYVFRLNESEIESWGTGSTFKAINRSHMSNIEIPLPPLAEQKRIVAKVEKLLASVDKVRPRLDRIPDLLKRLRQSILAAAVSGKLTEDWRQENPCTTTGQELLKSIFGSESTFDRNEYEQLWRPYPIPENWTHATLATIADLRLGKMLDKSKNTGKPINYLRNINVRWMSFDLSDLKTILAEDAEVEKLSVRNGDVLVCEGGEPGRASQWTLGSNDYIFQKALHRVRLRESIEPNLVVFNLWVDADTRKLEQLFTGSTIKHLTGRSLAKYPISLPPFDEQKEIVLRTEQLLRLTDRLEARYQKAKQSVDKLTQSILAKALRGELVPTEAELARQEGQSYETAEELLARIKNEADNPSKTYRRVKRRRKRKLSV